MWRALAERIHCTVNGDSPVRHQVTAFIEELKEKVREVWAPEDIVAILNLKTPTIDQINYLQNWRKARDTLVVWNELVEACRQQLPNAYRLGGPGWEAGFADLFPTGQLMIDRASRFSNWFVGNEPTLEQLTNLDFSHSKLRSIPMEIFHLPRLLELDISNCHLKELPEAMSHLTQLTKLDISFNKLSSLPDWLGNFRQLDSLYAGFNQLTSLPKWIGNLSLMVTLSLINNRIEDLPSEIGNLTQLRSLVLDGNKLKSLPDEMIRLIHLDWLRLADNLLTSLPDWLWTFNLLRYLDVSGNQLSSLSIQIGNLQVLQVLKLCRNQLTSVPNEIGSIPGLHTLDLGFNQFTTLQPGIFNQPNRKVWIEGNPLSLRFRVDHYVRTHPDSFVIRTTALAMLTLLASCTIYVNKEAIQSTLASSVGHVTGYLFE